MNPKDYTGAPTLCLNRIRLEPLAPAHAEGLAAAVRDGELWKLVYTTAPEPEHAAAYIQTAVDTPNRTSFAVIDEDSGRIVGTTSYHDINPDARRVEIGYTWYAQSAQRSRINTTCKYLLLEHAFETLSCQTVGWRTDIINTRSQAAIERLGAHKDGVLRGFQTRKDGSLRDTVMYSMTAAEWPQAKAHLRKRLGAAAFQAA